MRAPLSWLRQFAPVEGEPADLAATLSGLGLVVDGVERVGEGLGDVVVARVVATRPHPDADRVQLVDVDDGAGSRQVVCGAFNFGAGDLVPLAPIGARLPNGLEIGRRKVRGQWSEGMLCSPAELALAGDASGILVLGPNGESALSPGMALTEALGIEADVVFDIDVTPNRPDALSIAGIARDLAAALGVPFEIPTSSISADESSTSGTDVPLTVESPDLCPLFTATVLDGAAVGTSPTWLARRLVLAGMRPVNNLVDVSNLVMLELGHPNHPYDLDRLGGGGLLVRRGRQGETVVTLDEVSRPVGPSDCLICDADDAPVGVGGVMGGASSEITHRTTRVLLEAAWFQPAAIARTSKRLGLRTEASVRFERGVDPDGVRRAVARYVELAREVVGVHGPEATVERRGEVPAPGRIRLRTFRVNALLGTELSQDRVRELLEPIGFHCEPAGGGSADEAGELSVTIPSWRPDCEREVDVIEEVARHHGYGRIERTLPAIPQVGRLSRYQRDRRETRRILQGCGLDEAWATSFCSLDDLERAGLARRAVEIENPLVAEESALRPSLRPGLLRALVTNAAHRLSDVALFEIGHVFRPAEADTTTWDEGREPEHLAVMLGAGDAMDAVRIWQVLVEGLRLQSVAARPAPSPGLHPGRCVAVSVDGRDVGVVGELDPDVVVASGLEGPVGWFEVDLGAVLGASRRPASYRPVSRFPSADIDLAFELDESAAAGDVEATLRAALGELLEELTLFDVFRGAQLGAGRRSLAWRVRLSALDRTLTDDELRAARDAAIAAVEGAHPAKLRG